MFDVDITFDRPSYAERDRVTVAVTQPAASRPDDITVELAMYSLFEPAYHSDHTADGHALTCHDRCGMADGCPIEFTCEGNTASGPSLVDRGPLYVRVRDGQGREAATYVTVPISAHPTH